MKKPNTADEEVEEMRAHLARKISKHADLLVKVVLLESAIENLRIVCPVHHIPDCSPMLNGCSIPVNVRKQIDKAIEGLTGP